MTAAGTPGRLIELLIPSTPRHVALARLIVSTAAEQVGMTTDVVEDLKIAVSEATANAVNAQNAAGVTEPVRVCFGPDADGAFVVEIADDGSGFQPHERRDFDGRHWETMTGGLGVVLIRGLTDTCEFTRVDGMRVCLRFRVGIARTAERLEPANGH